MPSVRRSAAGAEVALAQEAEAEVLVQAAGLLDQVEECHGQVEECHVRVAASRDRAVGCLAPAG